MKNGKLKPGKKPKKWTPKELQESRKAWKKAKQDETIKESQFYKQRSLHYSTNPYLIAKKGGKVKVSNYNGWDIQPT